MRFRCWYCQKVVSNELPENSFLRAVAVCPECIEKSPEDDNHPLNVEQLAIKEKEIERLRDALISIEVYWNRDQNERSMADACWHSIETAKKALEETCGSVAGQQIKIES